MIDFYCIKWGTKYHSHYVNRLYSSIKKYYKGDFRFTCFTDDSSGISENIIIRDYNDTEVSKLKNIFTIQKLRLFDTNFLQTEKNVILDLDVLFLKDFTEYLDDFYNFKEPRFIKNYWADPDLCDAYFYKGACDVNSSFITWKDDQLQQIYDYYLENSKKINFLFSSLDKSLFSLYRNKLNYHPRNIVYAYNFGADFIKNDMEKEVLRNDYYLCIFNTSHGIGTEIHEADGWAKNMWESLDETV